jgi:tRNA(Ile)-lysidine synthase
MAMLALAVQAGCAVTAVHIDHGLRPDSASDAEVVKVGAARFGAAFRCERVDIAPGPNLEARAREVRNAALPSDALLAHTMDDNAETVLLNLLRGAGLEGLAGIRPDRRPLLALRRAETRRLCMELDLQVVDDPMNKDPRFRRNRVRHELLPLLDDIAERDVVGVIARQAALLREAADELDAMAGGIDPTDARAVAAAPPVLARQALRSWLRACSSEAHPPDAAAVDRVLAVAAGSTKATEIAEGWRVERHQQRLVLMSRADDVE